MTTNDKPVCYQYQPKGAKDWFSFNTAKERDEQMALVTGHYNGEMVARDLYTRPQPAAPHPWDYAHRYPDGVIRMGGGREYNRMLPVEAIPVYLGQPAAPQVPDDATCEAVYDAVTRASLTRDVKSPERKREIVRASLATPPAAPQVPDNEVCNTLPIDVRGKWYSVPVPVHLHIIALRDALATPPASSPQVPEGWMLVPNDGLCPDCRYAYGSDPCRESHATPPAPEQPGSDIARRVMRADEIQRRTGCSIATAVELARAGERQPAPEQPKPEWFKPVARSPHEPNPNEQVIRNARDALGPAHPLYDALDHAAAELAVLWARDIRRAEQPKPAGDVEAVVCLVGEPYAHGHCVELQVQVKPGTVFKNGDRLIRLAAQPAQGEVGEVSMNEQYSALAADAETLRAIRDSYAGRVQKFDSVTAMVDDADAFLAERKRQQGEA